MENITIKEFAEQVKAAVESRLGDTYKVSINEVPKNNDTKLTGLAIKAPGNNVSPCLYLEDALKAFENGTSLDEIADAFVRKYRESEGFNVDIESFTNWENAKNRIFFKLVNKTKNIKILADIPYMDIIGDLIVEYCLLVDNGEYGMESVLIRNSLLETWGNPTVKELHDLAMENTPRLFPANVKSMYETLCEMMGAEDLPFDEGDENLPLTVVSNVNKTNGAAVILYDGVLKEYAEKYDSDVYILPSSIHEILFLPVNKVDQDVSVLEELVQSVNAEKVMPTEYLSDMVYLYQKDTETITVA